jgi:type VI protein secretion system component VasK
MPFYPFLPELAGWVVLLILFGFAAFWVVQFTELMSLTDDRFTGQYVRLGWVAAFLVLWALAPFAFLFWNRQSRGSASAVAQAHRRRHKEAD